MSIADLLHGIKSSRSYENQIVHVEEIPSRQPEHTSIELKPLINYALDQIGIKRLYSHQAEAIMHVLSGKDIVLGTSSASGKSQSYIIPIFETVMTDSFLPWHRIWKRFFSNLKFIVVDESHYYRGVKGSNMANLLQGKEVIVRTFHSFCPSLSKDHADRCKVPGDFKIFEEMGSTVFNDRSYSRMFEKNWEVAFDSATATSEASFQPTKTSIYVSVPADALILGQQGSSSGIDHLRSLGVVSRLPWTETLFQVDRFGGFWYYMTKKSEELEAPGKTAMSVLAPGSGVKEYEEANNLIQRQSLDAAIDLALVRQGIDPQKVSKKDFDIIRRLNIKLNAINIKAQQEMSRIQQAAGNEYNGTILELNQVCMNLKVIQGVVPEPPAGAIEASATELPEATPAAPVETASAETATPVQETGPAET